MREVNMRGVVRTLRAENSQAALELLELGYSLQEIQRVLETLVPATSALRSTFASVFVVNDEGNLKRVDAFHEQANQLSALASHVVGALRQVREGVESWELGELCGHSGEPQPRGFAIDAEASGLVTRSAGQSGTSRAGAQNR